MAKQRTPEQEAIRVAKKLPERTFFLSRRMCWGQGKWPCRWSFFTNWTSFTIDIGEPTKKFHGPEVTESKFGFTIATRPFSFMVFWDGRRVLWIGDWEWKKSLRSD